MLLANGQKISDVLSFDLSAFPVLWSAIEKQARTEAVAKLPQDVATQHSMDTLLIPAKLALFSENEIKTIKELIGKAESSEKAVRNGGKTLAAHLQAISEAKEEAGIMLLRRAGKIHDILYPKEKVDTKVSLSKALQSKVAEIAQGYAKLDEKVLRQIGQTFLGDSQIDLTKDELPEAIAKKQLGV